MIPQTRRERYSNQPVPTRLGGLAADIARIASIAEIPSVAAVASLLDESSAFIEWSAPDLLPDRVDDAAHLVEIQRGLAYWRFVWHQLHNDPTKRKQLAAQARAWSDEILQMSGLLDQE
jgi:hypothetical protein